MATTTYESRDLLEAEIARLSIINEDNFSLQIILSSMNELLEKQHIIEKEILARNCIEVD